METNKDVKLALLEQKVGDFSVVVEKLDAAIEKLSEVNNNISRMLAVHEEKIIKQEETDSILFDQIDKLRDKMDIDYNVATSKIQLLERKLWASIAALGLILISSNPTVIKDIKGLISHRSSARLNSVATLINGSSR